MTLVQFQQPRLDFFLAVDTDAFASLITDPKGREKYQGFLEGAKHKLKLIEHSLRQLAGKGVIDENGFASALSDVRRGIEACCAGGWAGFTRACSKTLA
ncbi:MAG: hypothetical protein UX89_C0028G0001 [Parcubacteria group bacterium GW2011_GWA2_47_16]|nr:MAG: hypothetical protein UX89_C0028G0001 [Parcubacteria group bacterium GW2011_GWA2_47_16]